MVKIFRNDFVQTGQLNYIDLGDFAQGTNPVLVLGGDVDQDGQADLVTVNDQTVPPPGGAGGGGFAGPPENVVVLVNALCPGGAIPGDINGDCAVNVGAVPPAVSADVRSRHER